ncbi:unnamed protein product, partial [Didymodactylos carnosus]
CVVLSISSCVPDPQLIQRQVNDAHIPGIAAIVINSSQILYQRSFTHNKQFQGQHLNDKTIFLLGSISKTVVAIAAMQLVEQNQLDLDADINTYLNPLPEIVHPLYPDDPLTMRHLLTHTSSISSNVAVENSFYSPFDNYTATSLTELCLNYLIRGGYYYSPSNWQDFKTGTQVSYSDVGVALAGLIIELISKMPYDKYIREHIFKPLHLDDATVALADLTPEQRENIVKHYAFNTTVEEWSRFAPEIEFVEYDSDYPDIKWVNIGPYGFINYPARLLRMSALSLSKYLSMFLNNGTLNGVTILTAQSIAVIRTIQYPQYPDIESFGLLWYYSNVTSSDLSVTRRLLGHRGTTPGVRAAMMIDPLTNIGVILLSNGDIVLNEYQGHILAQQLNDILLYLFDCYS